MTAILALEDGRIFRGEGFGANGTATGEICFNTSMTGYQEILTDPSYRGQIVAMTYPEIGNYGVNDLDIESENPQVRGFVVEELSPVISSWRSQGSLHDYLAKSGIPAIQGVDTRALTRHLRTRGAMRACVSTIISDEAEAVGAARDASYEGIDFVKEVTTRQVAGWDADGMASRAWILRNAENGESDTDPMGNVFAPTLPPVHTLAAMDFGMKKNILRLLRRHGFEVTVVPARTSAADVLALGTDAVFLSNGPGDPEAIDYARDAVREIIGKKPLFGICLGHQILALALGGKTFKLKFGHRGANQPVKDLRTGQIAITSQNHGYAVDPDSLPDDVEVTHVNLNDGTVAGLRHKIHPAFSVQYHPEASPGPHDAGYFFSEFAKEVATSKAAGV
ncbi:MAG: glutamine-hydrolyzing carbamoyl-phosphate synthase small subunit [Terrimicrobiaceae bacterium]